MLGDKDISGLPTETPVYIKQWQQRDWLLGSFHTHQLPQGSRLGQTRRVLIALAFCLTATFL